MQTKIHEFEQAGLGKAPFSFVGVKVEKSKCQYCNQNIIYQYFVKDANGHQFFVGCDCILKTTDYNLINRAKMAKRQIDQAKAKARKELLYKKQVEKDIQSIREGKFHRGKYFGQLFEDVAKFDLQYILWFKDNISGAEDVVSTLKEVLEKFQPVIVEDPSKHLGVVGEKLQFTATLARKVHSDMYGCDILTFKDAEQNILMTFHGGKEVYEEGQTYNLIGTVKRHTEYKNVKQTQLSRIRKKKE